jgi:Tfp pilus assembly protein PilF
MPDNKKNIRRLAGFLQNNPNDIFTKFALALELLKAGESIKAKVLFESVLKQDPEYTGVYYHLGKLYQSSGRNEDAVKLFQKGIEIAGKQGKSRTKSELQEALEMINDE